MGVLWVSDVFRIGAGIIESEYVISHPKYLKRFKVGDQVFIVHMDDLEKMLNEREELVRELCALLDKSLNSELTDVELERAGKMIEIQKEINEKLDVR